MRAGEDQLPIHEADDRVRFRPPAALTHISGRLLQEEGVQVRVQRRKGLGDAHGGAAVGHTGRLQ